MIYVTNQNLAFQDGVIIPQTNVVYPLSILITTGFNDVLKNKKI